MFRRLFPKGAIFAATILFVQVLTIYGVNGNVRETPVVGVVKNNAEAVVNISTESIVLLRENPFWGSYGSEFDRLFDQFFGYRNPTRVLRLKSVGSGVILDKEGIIVTNAHVVHMASNIFVILNDGTSIEGQVMYESPQDDLAIVKIVSPKPLERIKLGRPDDIMIGETVVAVGNPLGLENSVSVGVISGKNREVYLSGSNVLSSNLLQIDAPINPGNSGGALLNLDGELVGINVAVVQNSQSIGFAIPVKRVATILKEYKNNQKFTIKRKRINQPATKDFGLHRRYQDEWDPFAEMDRMREEMDQMFQDVFNRSSSKSKKGMFNNKLSYDSNFVLKERDNEYIIECDISGLNQEKIDIEINEHSITVSGEYSEQTEEAYPESSFSSRSFGSFLRTFPVPEDADVSKLSTEKEANMLIIKLPKRG